MPQAWTFDAHLIDQGWQQTRGQQSCPTGAMRAICVDDEEMARIAREEGLEVMKPELGTKPRVYYKNLWRYATCFIGGTVSAEANGVVDCVEGADVRLLKDGAVVAEDAKRQLRRLQVRSARREFGRYVVEVSAPGRNQEGHRDQARRQHQSRRNPTIVDARHRRARFMLDSSTPLIVPALGLYQALSPWVVALLRVAVGLALVPHGLRMTFGLFANTGLPIRNLSMLADQLDRTGYRPGKLWAAAISATQLIGGPLLALGLFTRFAAVPIVLFLLVSNFERWRVGRYFWNTWGSNTRCCGRWRRSISSSMAAVFTRSIIS